MKNLNNPSPENPDSSIELEVFFLQVFLRNVKKGEMPMRNQCTLAV
jgi:hypothetical protein